MVSKSDFAGVIREAASTLANIGDSVSAYKGVYFDNEFEPGGANEIIDNDLTGVGITAEELGNTLTTLNSLTNWLDGTTVTAADNRAVLNQVRQSLPRT